MNDHVRELCQKYTNLTAEDIVILEKETLKLEQYQKESGKSIFIDCPCIVPSEAVVVAECLNDNNPYAKTTIGCIVREIDEPAVFRSLKNGEPTEHVGAGIFQQDEFLGKMIQSVYPIKNEEKIIGVIIYEMTELELEDSNLVMSKQDEEKMDAVCPLGKYLEDPIILINEKQVIQYYNRAAAIFFRKNGYYDELYKKSYQLFSIHEPIVLQEDEMERKIEVSYGGGFYQIKISRWENPIWRLIIIKDMTALQEEREKLLLNATVVQECHHRIKNNLQMILSLLQMQKRRIHDKDMEDVLQDTMNRIMSISMTHEILLGKDMDEIHLLALLERLANHYTLINSGNECQVNIQVTGDDIIVNSAMSSVIALIVNELLQNCFKYAFTGRKKGNIQIIVTKQFMGYAKVSIEDDGNGFDTQIEKKKSLGLRIVNNLVQDKCKGRIETVSGKEGTKTTFDFRTKTE